MRDIEVAIVYHSGSGHTGRQAEAVARGAASIADIDVGLYRLETAPEDLWDRLNRAAAIVFGTPTYMGGPSARFKIFAEDSSKIWGDGLRWKDKIAAGFTNSGSMSGDKLNTLISLAVFAAQHGMHWVGLGLYPGWSSSDGSAEDANRLGSYLGAMAQSNMDQGPDIAPPPSDLATAELLGRRVAEATRQWVRGRRVLDELGQGGVAAAA